MHTPYIISEYRNEIKANSIAVKCPKLLEIWHPTKNLPLAPDRVTMGMHIKIWWHCDVCGHDWTASPATRKRGVGCPCCAGKVVKAGFNDIATLFPHLKEEWDYDANEDKRPEQFIKGSSEVINWICSQGHRWSAKIYSRTKGTGCPICSRKHATEELIKSN